MNTNIKSYESGDEGMIKLIKQAGKDARSRKIAAMEVHAKKLKETIAEAISKNQKHTTV